MKKLFAQFLINDQGQDLVEYTLLIGFMVTVLSALVVGNSGSIQGILFVTTSNLNSANSVAS
jgi:Flp pilus assembly pilin Flp